MSPHYFDTFTSVIQFKGRNQKYPSELKMSAASGWGRDHLLACRVIIRPQRPNILPILSQHFKYSDTTSSVDITKFLGGPDSNTHFQKSEHSLVRDFGYSISLAQTWSALGAFKGDRDAKRTGYAIAPGNSEHSDTESDGADSDVPMATEFDGGRITRAKGRGAREESSEPTVPF
ncbi:hypothetical protein DTO013E5_5979 [Penicillium roqueforti]|uniref:Genomic scaffold, ProqFM164S01 n=1 Tax=Penicillium roqueforti (strain FM164) TaxID=1365484 RepID=W6Q537_PENRF|nr:uncharacterized protein LCP9604111_5409 [Penicillium roqueforti]CDM29289.1 unnamed protein product [Penicillium roqueforti FM164]KAF9248154.1 hypothetical protein LCP9604111_5409 [Penicillium roqueforti]KAI1836011.1 hypothetical protein CBS147337_3160 [Penicillium roqueforti]KAI2678399.1 hypothetical protein LCP963914a_7830 [Penicillium roqueforti]KAI2683033.1 hypothetical protein CBS147355_2173 [Penicillium roqueforti]